MSGPVEKSIIRIYAKDESIVGAGFLVSERHALTCAHVVAAALGADAHSPNKPTEEISFDFPFSKSGNRVTGHVSVWKEIRSDEGEQPYSDEDIAVIELSHDAPAGCAPASVVRSDVLKKTEFNSFGFPIGLDKGVPASGIVTGKIEGGCVVIEDTKAHGYFIKRGFSGGPAWIEDRKLKGVIGMVVSADEKNRAAYIIPAASLFSLLPGSIVYSPAALNMADPPPDDFVARPREFDQLLDLLLDPDREKPVAITAALEGAGGYGKTTLAMALCHDERVTSAFTDGVLWVTLGEDPGELTGRVLNLIEYITDERPGFTDINAATARLAELLADRKMLIVIDDVWDEAHLRSFLRGGPQCAHLITTRISSTLPVGAKEVKVDAMQQDEAVKLLRAGLTKGCEKELRNLAALLGEWPLLLKLANGTLRDQVHNTGQSLKDAINWVRLALDRRGMTAFDSRDSEARNRAVARTLGVSFELLNDTERARYFELAVFPEVANVPLATLERYWRLDDFDTDTLCTRLNGLSLLLNFDGATIRLHDVVRKYLIGERRRELAALHNRLLEAHSPSSGRWADLDDREPYLWDYLATHLIEAGRGSELVATVKDLRYLARKTWVRDVSATERDLLEAEKQAARDATLYALRRSFVNCGHLLTPDARKNEGQLKALMATMHSRFQHVKALAPLARKLERSIPRPYVTSLHRLPDLPHPALIRTLTGHTSSVYACAMSADGRLIVSGSNDKTLKVWDSKTGAEIHTLSGHTSLVSDCAISADGRLIVSASFDNTLKVWDAKSGKRLHALSGHTDSVRGCAISADGTLIVSASADKTLKVWDAKSGTELHTLSGHTSIMSDCAISADGSLIVSASADETLKVWDAKSGKRLHTLSGHTDSVTGCAISADGTLIVSASSDSTLKVWDSKTGAELHTLSGHTHWVSGCAISADGTLIVSASADETLKVWDAKSGKRLHTLSGHTDSVNGCAISADGSLIVSASSDKTLKVWDAKSGKRLHTLSGHTSIMSGCAISADGRLIISAPWNEPLKVWDAKSGKKLHTLSGHTSVVRGCAISADGRLIVSASADKTLKVWDAKTGAKLRTLTGHTDPVNGCAISADGRLIVSASDDKTLKVWDAETGTELHTLTGHTSAVWGCAISADGSLIVSASHESLKVWDAKSGKELHTLSGNTDSVTDCAMSADGSLIVSASWDNTLKVWDAETGTELHTLSGNTDSVTCCAISADGSLIVSASDDKTLRVWDTETGACIATFRTEGTLEGCACSADGRVIVAVGAGGVYILKLER